MSTNTSRDAKFHPMFVFLAYPVLLIVAAILVILPVTVLLNALGYPVASGEEPVRIADVLRESISVFLTLLAGIGATWI